MKTLLWYGLTSVLLLMPLPASAADALMLSGFDPQQTVAPTYSEATKDPAATPYRDALFYNASDPVIGSNDAKIIIVEFYDYRCPHCVTMSPVLNNLLTRHANVRIVYKEYPIRGKLSMYCAKATLAARNQGKFADLHYALMNADTLNETKVLDIAKSLGLDMQRLQTDMASDTIDNSIRANYELGHHLQVEGTPTFFILQTTGTDAPYLITGEIEPTYLQNLITRLDH